MAGRARRCVVTGAFGYTGRHIAMRLLADGDAVATLTGRQAPRARDPLAGRVEGHPLRFSAPDELRRHLQGADVLFNTYWVRFARGRLDHAAAVRNSLALIAAAEDAGVRRIVHVSITGASRSSPLSYFRGKAEVEARLLASRVPHAIVRPTLVFGGGDVLLNNIAWFLRRLPVFTVFGTGGYPVQPVHVDDVAELAVAASQSNDNVVVDAAGPDTITFMDVVRAVARAVGGRAAILPAPPMVAVAMAGAVGAVMGDIVVTPDEVAGLMAGLLVSREPPTGRRRLRDWLAESGRELGVRYVSELARHYRGRDGGRA